MRPSLDDILKSSIKRISKLDLEKSSDSLELVMYENETFYYRVIYLFIKEASKHYSDEELRIWLQRELVGVSLPELT